MIVNRNTIPDPEMMSADDGGSAAQTTRPANGASNPGDGISKRDGAQLFVGALVGGFFGSPFGPPGVVIGSFVGAVVFDGVD